MGHPVDTYIRGRENEGDRENGIEKEKNLNPNQLLVDPAPPLSKPGRIMESGSGSSTLLTRI